MGMNVVKCLGLISGGVSMSGVRIGVTVLFIVVSAVLIFLVFQGKGEGADLSGGIVSSSNNDTYFATHGKKHTEDARRERATLVLVAVFVVLSIILNMGWGF
jgi:protein translocase SecG subunit